MKWRSVFRIAGVTLFVVLTTVLLAVGGLWTLAQTDWGGATIRRMAVSRVNDRIAGRIGLDRLRFGGDRLTLDGLVLRDPDGDVVARVARLDVQFAVWPLLHRRVALRKVEIQQPELTLTTDASGSSNLARALAPAHPPPAAPPPRKASAGGPDITVDLRALALTGGTVTVHQGGMEVHLGAIEVHGSAHYAGRAGKLTTDLQMTTDAGQVAAAGALTLAPLRAAPAGFHVRVRDLDLGEVVSGWPRSRVALDLGARGERVAMDLDAQAPGASLTGHGALDGKQLDARLRVEATDLAATARSLTRSNLMPPLHLSGQGRIDLAVSGPLPRPSVRVAARIPRLAVNGNAARDLTLSAEVPRLDRPEALDLDAAASSARISGRDLRGIHAHVRASGRNIDADLRTASPYPVKLTLSGRRLSGRALEIARLTLRYPEETWRLVHRTRIAFGDGRLVLDGLDLRARDQVVRGDLNLAGPRGHLRLKVVHLDPGRLPRPLIPPALAKAGTIDVDTDLHFSAARVRGNLAVRGLGIGLRARLDLPARWPLRDTRAPLRLDLATDEIDLAALGRTIAELSGKPLPHAPRGEAQLAVTLEGRVGRPKLDARLTGRRIAIDGRPVGDLTMTLDGGDERPLALLVQLAHPGLPPATVKVESEQALAALLRHPALPALTHLPLELEAHVQRVPLALVGKLVGHPVFKAGTATLELHGHGTVDDPVGEAAIDLHGATGPRFPPTDARVELNVDRRSSGANVRIVRQGHPLLALTARLGAGLAELRDASGLARKSIDVRAVVGPLQMHRRGLPTLSGQGVTESALDGTLHADLTLQGTLGTPRLRAHVQAGGLTLDRSPLGAAQLEADYADGQARVEANAQSANGGTLTLKVGARADLGLGAFRAGKVDPTRWSYDLFLQAQRLDLRGFSGLTPTIERTAGVLDAQVTAHGPLDDPRFSGQVACAACELHLAGIGAFRDIHLALHGDTDKVVLDELAAKSGDGSARVTATLTRSADHKVYAVTGKITSRDIPVYQEGQPLAQVSLDAALSGTSGGHGNEADLSVEIHEAHLNLSDQKRRKLQSLKTPSDVVIVADGKPIDRAQARKLRALQRRHAAAQAEAATGAPAAKPRSPRHGLWKKIRIAVVAPRQLWVKGGGANLELGLGPGFHVIIAQAVGVHGEVVVRRGRVDVLGRRLDLKADSSLQFEGPPGRPILDATAQYQNNDNNVTVLITAKGPIDQLSIKISSPNRPDLTDAQLYALIVTGHLAGSSTGPSESAGTAASNEATSLVAGLIAGQLQKTLAKHLPLDVLTIDTGSGPNLSGTQLEAGRYVTDRLYVGYVGRVGADPTRYQNRNAVHLEYQLTQRWQIAGEYGDVGTGTVDLMWKKNY